MSAYPCPQYPVPPNTQVAADALFLALTSGTKEVQYADKRVVYQNIDDMWRVYNWLIGLLNPCFSSGPRRIVADFDSGLQSRRGGMYETEEGPFRY